MLTRQLHRALAVLATSAAASLVPGLASAQLAVQRSNESFLILPPVAANAADSAFSIQVTDAIRKKVEGKFRLKLNVVKKEKIVEALASSGFPPDAILEETGAVQLARFMNVDAYMHGEVQRTGGAAALDLRLVDQSSSGLSGWMHIRSPNGATPDQIADIVADSVDLQIKAAERARECLERRDKKEFGSAQDRAARAFAIFPNHPSTAMCLNNVFIAMNAPADSQIAALKRAVAGDSLLIKGWEGLMRQYQTKGDTAAWAEAVVKSLAIDPTDMRKRLAAAELQFRLKRSLEAVQLLDEGLERSPGDAQATQAKLRYCFEGQMWGCALEAMGTRYESDSSVQNDTLVMKQLLATAGATNDPATITGYAQLSDKAKKYYQLAPDTAALLKWTGVAVQKFPTNVSFWRQRAVALKDAGKRDEALAAYRKIAELDPRDINSRIALVQMLSDSTSLRIDSLTPLDTVKLAEIDKNLGQVASITTDDNIKMNVAVMYFTPATKMVQAKKGLDLAVDWLEKTKANDTRKQLTGQANFFQGLAYTFNLQVKYNFDAVSKSKDCKQLQSVNEYMAKLNGFLTAGMSEQTRPTITQIRTSLAGIDKFIGQAKPAWKCRF